MSINSLEQSQADPDGNSEQMQIASEVTPNQWQTNSSHSQKGNLYWMSVLSGETKRSSVSVMLFMDIFVENTIVQTSMEPVVPCIFHYEENTQVQENLRNGWEWDGEAHTDLGTDWMKEPDRQSLDHEMRNNNRFHTFPLFRVAWDLGVLNLILLEVRDTIDDEPGQTTAKVHDLVHEEEKESSSKNVIVHPVVVGTPNLFEDIEASYLIKVLISIGKGGDIREARVVAKNSTAC